MKDFLLLLNRYFQGFCPDFWEHYFSGTAFDAALTSCCFLYINRCNIFCINRVKLFEKPLSIRHFNRLLYDLPTIYFLLTMYKPKENVARVKVHLWLLIFLKKLYGLFLWMGFSCLKAREPLRRDSLVKKFLVLIWLTSEGWKAEPNFEPPSGFEQAYPGLAIQRLNHKAIAPW